MFSVDGMMEKTDGKEIYKYAEARELVSYVREDLLKAPGARYALMDFNAHGFFQSQLRSAADGLLDSGDGLGLPYRPNVASAFCNVVESVSSPV